MGVYPILGIVAILSLLGFLIYYDGYGSVVPNELNQYLSLSTIFPDGSEIVLLVEDQPVSEKSSPIEKKVVTDDEGNQSVVEVDVPNMVAPVKGITQYFKSDPNGVVVQGYIILTDSNTNQVIKPYQYNALIEIRCDEELNNNDGFNYCSTDPVFGRVFTTDGGKDKDGNDNGGFFIYKWHPSNKVQEGFYDVKILILPSQSSQHPHSDHEMTYKIQVLN